MNTLATQHPMDSFHRAERPKARLPGQNDRQGGLFLVGSVALHVGLLVAFASVPGPAHASSEEQLVEITMFEEQLPEVVEPEPEPIAQPEPEKFLPRGTLDAPVERAPTSAPVDAPVEPAAVPVEAAPEVLATDNPYASANAAVFTSGSTSDTPAVIKKKTVAPGFGVKNGSLDADKDKTKELKAWYAKVRARFAAVATSSYPRRALKLRQEGTVKIGVTIDQSGKVLQAVLASSSGGAVLDQGALASSRSISRVDAPPQGAGTVRLTVTQHYRLR